MRIAVLCSVLALFFASCAPDTSTTSDNMAIQGEMTAWSVSSAQSTKGAIQDTSIIGLDITSMEFTIKDIKLQEKTNSEDISVRKAAAVLTVDPTDAHLTTSGHVPAGTYNKVEINIHRLNDSERASLINDPAFADFLDNNRYSVIIKGNVHVGGQTYPFTYGGKLDEAIKLDMADVSVADNGVTTIAIQFDPIIIFKSSTFILDPRDANNNAAIQANIKLSLKARKK